MKNVLVLLLASLCVTGYTPAKREAGTSLKMDGVCFVAPPRKPAGNPLTGIQEIGAGWVAITPYAFSRAGEPMVKGNYSQQWWGERTDGARKTVAWAREKGLKIMLKPHVWVRGQGWCGDFDLANEAEWLEWEKQYIEYVVPLARMAQETDVELFCIGTEYRQAVKNAPACWTRIICAIREVYSGKLTYASNWDNYEYVDFWEDLDYIGIDAYFPLTESADPSVKDLQKAWKPWSQKLKVLSTHHKKPILFTEYGYRPVAETAARPWETKGGTLNLDMQSRAYEALYRSFWNQEWFAGGFLWKWFADPQAGGPDHKGFTPQNKPALQQIQSWYSAN